MPAGDAHILHVVPGLVPGGMELTLVRIIRGLQGRDGLRHSVVALKGDPVLAPELPPDVPVHGLRSRPNEPALPWRLWRLMREVRPTVIHARNWGGWPDVALARLALWPPVPLIFSFHGFADPRKTPLRRRLAFRALSRMTTCLFTVSENARNMLVERFGWPRHRVGIIPNGVDVDRFRPGPVAREPDGEIAIGTVGSLTPVKNHALLVRACAAMRAAGVACRLRIAGEGPERRRLEELARSLDYAAHLDLPGHVEDVPGFLRTLDVFSLPSASEAHPNALLEAMACGLPCVATRVGGVEEILGRGAFGRIVEPGDEAGLAEVLSDLAGDAEARRKLEAAGRQRVRDAYSLEGMLETYAELYTRVSEGGLRTPVEPRGFDPVANRPRVLMLGPLPPPIGGMATVTENLRTSALARRCRLTVRENGKATPEGRPLARGVAAQMKLLADVAGLIVRGRSRIVHFQTCALFTFWRDMVHAAVARLAGAHVVFHVHDGTFESFLGDAPPLKKALLSLALRAASRVIVLSEETRERLAPLERRARWAVVSNGVPVPSAAETERAPRFLFMGNLTRRKGAYDLVEATSRAFANGGPGEVLLAGGERDAGDRQALLDHIAACGCAERARLLGLIQGPEKEAALASAGVLVLPSYAEGLPMAILEGMAYALPVIATRVGAVPEAVAEGVEGFLIEPGDVEALADRMRRLAEDAALRRRMAQAARRRARAQYGMDVMVDRILALYREILTPDRGRA